MAYQNGDITLQSKIRIRMEREWNGEKRRKLVDTSLGRVIFNNAIPQDLGYVDRSIEENAFKLEVDKLVAKGDLKGIVDRCYRRHGATTTSEVLDRIKALGFKYSTRGGITVGFQDITVPEKKPEILAAAEKRWTASTTFIVPVSFPRRNAEAALSAFGKRQPTRLPMP